MFERLPFWGQVVLMVALAALLVAIAYYAFPNLKSLRAESDALRTQYAEMQGKIREGRAIEQKLQEFEREIASLQRKLGDVQQTLPTGPETGDLLRWIKNLADQSNLELKSFGPGAMRPVEFYKEFPIDMNVVGRYHDLGIFLDRVSKYQRIINVDNLRMAGNPGGGDKSIRANFTATTFVYDDSAELAQEATP